MTVAQKKLSQGKLPANILKRLLKRYATESKSVVVGPAVGIDCAVIDFHGQYLLAKTDPITFVAEDIGLYALHINANDIAVMGGVPRWFLATVLLPEGSATEEAAERIFSQISRACKSLGVTLSGGHTEITRGIEMPIIVGQMLGEAKKGRLVTTAGARPGDAVILTKGIAIEGTSIIARKKGESLVKKGVFSKRFIARCKNLVKTPGISVMEDAKTAMKNASVHAMHDPTEGGLATGLHELATAACCGVLVYEDSIAVLPESRKICDHFGLDPLSLIASGALVAAIDPRDTDKALKGLKKAGINAAQIGVVTEKSRGVVISGKSGERALPYPERDEITKIF
ncbi:MAG: AIR synthase family protein [Thermodesulfobacteriota bacterium]|nr:MAG: AIR synthase family protein [Thermodesulfobacteriota bacterium]